MNCKIITTNIKGYLKSNKMVIISDDEKLITLGIGSMLEIELNDVEQFKFYKIIKKENDEHLVDWDKVLIPKSEITFSNPKSKLIWAESASRRKLKDGVELIAAILWDDNYCVDSELNKYPIKNLEKYIELDNHQWLFNDYGKYRSGVTFVLEKPISLNRLWQSAKLNYSEGSFTEIIGDFWVSKKGTNCFRPKTNGNHKLICDSWGGAFNKYRGNTLPFQTTGDILYANQASSNGGGSGNDYIIVKKDWDNKLSLSQI